MLVWDVTSKYSRCLSQGSAASLIYFSVRACARREIVYCRREKIETWSAVSRIWLLSLSATFTAVTQARDLFGFSLSGSRETTINKSWGRFFFGFTTINLYGFWRNADWNRVGYSSIRVKMFIVDFCAVLLPLNFCSPVCVCVLRHYLWSGLIVRGTFILCSSAGELNTADIISWGFASSS